MTQAIVVLIIGFVGLAASAILVVLAGEAIGVLIAAFLEAFR